MSKWLDFEIKYLTEEHSVKTLEQLEIGLLELNKAHEACNNRRRDAIKTKLRRMGLKSKKKETSPPQWELDYIYANYSKKNSEQIRLDLYKLNKSKGLEVNRSIQWIYTIASMAGVKKDQSELKKTREQQEKNIASQNARFKLRRKIKDEYLKICPERILIKAKQRDRS